MTSSSPGLGDGRSLDREPFLAWLLTIGGTAGLVASVVLILEKLAVLEDPAYIPSCNLSPVINCGSIMTSAQAEAFGFPNPLIGLVSFPVLIVTGAAVLAGARMHRWFWLGLQGGVLLGTVFTGWLIFQSLYRIDALCPYCMIVWVVVALSAWYLTLHNLWAGRFGTRAATSAVANQLRHGHALVPMFALLVLTGLIVERFWSYWVTVL